MALGREGGGGALGMIKGQKGRAQGSRREGASGLERNPPLKGSGRLSDC